MIVKIKVKIDPRKIDMVLDSFSFLLQQNIVTSLREFAVPDLIVKIMAGFDNLANIADMLPEDPTNPSNWRPEFLDGLYRDLADTFQFDGKKIMVKLGDKDFLGYDPSGAKNDPKDSEPLHWMVYYLEGLIGDWAFITPEIYARKRNRGLPPTWGRFGEGFMISKERFFKEGWQQVVSFEAARHPFSGFSPVDIFAEAIREFRLRPYVERAIKATVEGRRL